jgi:CheY-like chemotaxis protein
MLRILITDDHEMIRRSLRDLLERHEGWEVCAEASNGREPSNPREACPLTLRCLIWQCRTATDVKRHVRSKRRFRTRRF